jgi:hypothetical protein
VTTLTVYDGELIAGGGFSSAGGVPANNVASWNGSNWSALGSGINSSVISLAVYDNQLIAGGGFSSAGGAPAAGAASWNGSSWSPLGSGTNNWVQALAVYDNKLFAAGDFTIAGEKVSAYLAAWDTDPTGIDDGQVPPPEVTLSQNYPNPFNPATTISFWLPRRENANLSVYNIEGKLVATLFDEALDAGFKKVVWQGKDARGNQVSSGVYFYKLTAGNKTLTKKMVLLR